MYVPRSSEAGPPRGDELVDAVLAASRALVAVAARSLADFADDITLPQYRMVVELARRGPQRIADLAGVMGVEPSTATRMCERLVRKGVVHRRRTSTDRREVRVSLTTHGRRLVEAVTARRRSEIERILRCLPNEDRSPVLAALGAFAEAAGEASEQHWALGWDMGVEPD